MLRIEPYFDVSTSIFYTPEQQLAIDNYLPQNHTVPGQSVIRKAGSVFAVFNATAYKMASWILEEEEKGVEIMPVLFSGGTTRGKFDSPQSFGPLHLLKLFKADGLLVESVWKVLPIHFGFASAAKLVALPDQQVGEYLCFDFC